MVDLKKVVKEKFEEKKKELREKRLGKMMTKVSQAQEKKEREFKAIVKTLDKQMMEFGKYANGLNKEVQELTKRVEKLEGNNGT